MKTFSKSAAACRWTSRVLSLLVIAFMVYMAIGEGMPNPFTGHMSAISMLGFIAVAAMVVGYLAGWRWELAGGILSLVGVFLLVEPTRVNGKVTWFFAVLAAPGVLYIASHLLRGQASGQRKAQPPIPGPAP